MLHFPAASDSAMLFPGFPGHALLFGPGYWKTICPWVVLLYVYYEAGQLTTSLRQSLFLFVQYSLLVLPLNYNSRFNIDGELL